MDLNSLEVYYKFKSGSGITTNQVYPPDCTYRINVTRPHNLRPSLIRWQYKDSDGVLHYKNIFDLAVIKNAYANPENLKSPKHRKAVQDILHNLHDGIFTDDDGNLKQIEPGTLENTEAELIMSNLYKETFGIEDESLAEVLEQGENYFERQARNLKSPVSYDYDIAFLRENGKHTLLTIANVRPGETIRENPFGNNTFTNAQGEIYLTSNGQNLFKIGKWQYDDTVVYDEATQKFVSTDKKELDQAQYRIYEGRVQKRYDYVTRYTLLAPKKTKNGTIYQNNTLYKIADIDTIKKALNITDVKGNIFNTKAQTIVNSVNCVGVMGKGIALVYKLRYPHMFDIYRDYCKRHLIGIGSLWLYRGEPDEPLVLNFPTKFHWKYPSKIEYIELGLAKFVATYKAKGITSIAFPMLGTNNGGLSKDDVLPIMERYLSKCDIPIEIYDYDPNASDDLYERFKSVWQSINDIEKKACGIRSISQIHAINKAIEDNTIKSMIALINYDGVGMKTMESCFKLVMNYNMK